MSRIYKNINIKEKRDHFDQAEFYKNFNNTNCTNYFYIFILRRK